jgi:uncharacterized protein (DUF1499 family)
MKFNKIFPWILVGIVVFATSPYLLGLFWPRINDIKTGETPQYADLQPQRFDQPIEKVYDAALTSLRAMGLEIREEKRDPSGNRGIIEAVATTPIFKFKEDVTVTLTRQDGPTVVNVRSKSRIGKRDWGTNARRIRAFQAELAKRL